MAQEKAASYGLDNLSRLPDELLLHIVSLLPMKDAVRTSALSTRWQYLYASSSILDFCSSDENMTCVDVINALEKVFYYRCRRPINRFRIGWRDQEDFEPEHIYGWIKCVMWHGIQEVDIDIPSNLLLPDSLFTCKTLVVLRLKLESYNEYDTNLVLPARVFLPSLKVLALQNVISFTDDDDACERLFSNCPVLEEFDYCFQLCDCKLIICHPTLKRLAIRDHWENSYERFEIVVNAPSVIYLEYLITSTNCHTVMDVRSLIEAEIGFYYEGRYTEDNINTSYPTSVMRGISNVHKLNMSCITLLFFQNCEVPMPVFHNLTHLVITSADFLGMGGMLHFLPYCKSLETLDFEELPIGDIIGFDINGLPIVRDFDFYANQPSRASCLSFHLKTISISTFRGIAKEMDIIKYFLQSARVLETLKIVTSDIKPEELSKVRDLLHTFPRASNKCSIVLVDELRLCLMLSSREVSSSSR